MDSSNLASLWNSILFLLQSCVLFLMITSPKKKSLLLPILLFAAFLIVDVLGFASLYINIPLTGPLLGFLDNQIVKTTMDIVLGLIAPVLTIGLLAWLISIKYKERKSQEA